MEKLKSLTTEKAEKEPGVIAVITYKNAPKIGKPVAFDTTEGSGSAHSSDVPFLHDANIYWNGQPVAIVIAETQSQAEAGAWLVEIEYETAKSATDFEKEKKKAHTPKKIMGQPAEVKVADADRSLKDAATSVDNIYRTPRYNHNAIEPHATLAFWDKDNHLTVFDCTQNLYGFKSNFAQVFGLKDDQVRVIAPFLGGGFGGKGMMWQNSILCALAARVVKRPVKLALSREGVFRIVGGRTLSEQRVALGVSADNKFQSFIHTGFTATTAHNNFPEQISFPARFLYQSESFLISQKAVNLDTVANTFMRAPGESIGTFAIECAIDELACKLNIDPIELRRLNEPSVDPLKGNTFSSRHLMKAYEDGARAFGWKQQPVGSQIDGKWMIGQGVATAYYPYYRFPGKAKIRVTADGTANIQIAAHEMGMGTATVQLQHFADRIGLPIDKVTLAYGHTGLPESPQAGGSSQTASISAAMIATCEKLVARLVAIAHESSDSPLKDLRFDQVELKNGGVYSKLNDDARGESYQSLLRRANKDYVEIEATSGNPIELMKYSMHSYGAQFCEVRVNKTTGETRVSRWVGSFDAGKILNGKTATSQFKGGIIMGIGMALTEETLFDTRSGRIVNPSLAEYHVPVHLDIPEIEILYTNVPDEHSPLGAHGIGEIGITGAAAAIANAIYNATGKRIRELPITLDKLL